MKEAQPQLPSPDPNDLGAISHKMGAQLGAVLVELTAAQHLLMKLVGENEILQRQYDSAMAELDKLRVKLAAYDVPGAMAQQANLTIGGMNGSDQMNVANPYGL